MRQNKLGNVTIDNTIKPIGPVSLRRLRNDTIVSKYKPHKIVKSRLSLADKAAKDASYIEQKMKEKYDAIVDRAEDYVNKK